MSIDLKYRTNLNRIIQEAIDKERSKEETNDAPVVEKKVEEVVKTEEKKDVSCMEIFWFIIV